MAPLKSSNAKIRYIPESDCAIVTFTQLDKRLTFTAFGPENLWRLLREATTEMFETAHANYLANCARKNAQPSGDEMLEQYFSNGGKIHKISDKPKKRDIDPELNLATLLAGIKENTE